MAAQTKPYYITPEEYLRRERDAETRSEYHDGVIVAMAGANPEHNIIAANVIIQLNTQLRHRGCIPFTSDQRVRVDACNRYCYPDTTVVCDQPAYQMLEGLRSLVNPSLVVEVLSDSTAAQDRGDKWHCYQTLESLTTYILIAQDRARVEVYTRMEDGDWRLSTFHGLEATLRLPAYGCEIGMADIYADVVFPEPTNDTVETDRRDV
jgi:Uma2 family endonuclease